MGGASLPAAGLGSMLARFSPGGESGRILVGVLATPLMGAQGTKTPLIDRFVPLEGFTMSVLHNRYVIVAACALGLGLSFPPMFFYTLPSLMKPMAEANGWSRTEVSTGVSVATLFLALGAPLVGGLVDRFGVRRVVITSTVLFASMLYAFSWTTPAIAVYYALAALLGLSSIGASPLSYSALIAKWFDARLGTALGVAMVGMGIGYALAPVLAAHLIEAVGWRGAYVALSAIAIIPVVSALLFVREPGAGAVVEPTLQVSQGRGEGLTLREASRKRAFWLIAGCAFLVSTSVNGTAVHLVALMNDRGLTLSDAARAGAMIGIAATLARFITGFLLDYLPTPLIAAVAFFGASAGLLLLWGGAGGLVPYVAAACMGLASGAEADILAFASRRYFGSRAYGKIYGLVAAAFTLGAVVGPLLLGFSYDHLGGYAVMLLAYAACCFLAAIGALCMGQPQFARKRLPGLPKSGGTGLSPAKGHMTR